MENMMDYIRWRGDLSFRQDPVNCVDALIFASLAYVRFQGAMLAFPWLPVSLKDAAKTVLQSEDREQLVREKEDLELLQAAADSRRFGELLLVHFREQFLPEQDTQFAAVSFLLDNGTAVAAFRGTDNTLVGWKEDFNMTFLEEVPSQRLALEYIQNMFAEFRRPMSLCGHSKGGNLAVYAGAKAEPILQSQIQRIYNLDGPGFTEKMLQDPGYKRIIPKILTIIPQSSIVGLMLEHEEQFTIIHSQQVGVLQHDGYSWEVAGKAFVPESALTSDSLFVNRTLKTWMYSMEPEERSKAVDALFSLLNSGEVDTVSDILQPKNIRRYLHILETNTSVRTLLLEELQSLADSVKTSVQLLDRKKLPPA